MNPRRRPHCTEGGPEQPEPEPQSTESGDHPPRPCAKGRRLRKLSPEEIIAAAAECFYTNGYADTSLGAVAGKLNVTDKAFYHYFKSKDLLYLETVNRCMDWVTAIIETIDIGEETGLDKIKKFARTMIHHSVKRRPYLRSLPEHLENTDLGRRFRALERAQEQILIGWVREGINDGSIRPGDPQMLWKWNQGALIWLDAWARDHRTYDPTLLERAAMTMLDRSLGAAPDRSDSQ